MFTPSPDQPCVNEKNMTSLIINENSSGTQPGDVSLHYLCCCAQQLWPSFLPLLLLFTRMILCINLYITSQNTVKTISDIN